jgi:hypothetical protein
MRLNRLLYFFALLLALPLAGYGQTVPVAPNMLLDIGEMYADLSPSILKFDAQGNIYVAGNYNSSNSVDFDPSAGVTKLTQPSGGFVAKYSAAGALVWVKSLEERFMRGGSEANGLDIDRNGNITVIGRRTPLREIDPYFDHNFYSDAFILHLDNNGNVLWEKFIESGNKGLPTGRNEVNIYIDEEIGYKVASDDAGNLIAVYTFGGSPDVDGKITAKGNNDGLVVKYDPNGNVIWKFSLGATGGVNNSALAALVDKDNNIIIAGYTNGTVNYNPLGAPVNITKNSDMFIAKYSPAGILLWVKSIDGYMVDYNIKLALDGQDNIYINGAFTSPIDFGVAPALNPKTYQDVFIAKYSSGGNLLYHKSIGGVDAYTANRGVVAGPDGSLYLTGSIKGKVDFDPSASVSEVNSNGTVSTYLAKYDDNGNYQWVFSIPSNNNADALSIIRLGTGDFVTNGVQYVNVNSSNEILLTGSFHGTVNFDGTGCGVSNMTQQGVQGRYDMFIVRYVPTTLTPITNNAIAAPAVNNICPDDDPGLITGSIPVGNVYTYQWQQSSNNIAFTDIPGAVSQDFDPPVITATTYYRRRLVSSVCAAPNISNVVTVTLSKPATVNTITAPVVISFCNAGDAGLIRGSVPQANGTVDYQWQQSIDNVTFTHISGATAKDYDPPSTGVTTYYRRLINNTPCSIGVPGNTVTITIIPIPIPTVSAEQTVCVGDGVTLNATGGTRYSWSPATGLSSASGASPVATPNL